MGIEHSANVLVKGGMIVQESYEYKSVTLAGLSTGALQNLGDEGWEAIEAKPLIGGSIEFMFRRPADPSYRPSWEYHLFRDIGANALSWKNHLSSCGWTNIVNVRFYSYSADIAMRPERWRGTDDGDILARAQDLGYSLFWGATANIEQILSIKWTESEKRGYNIGTYEAVRHWLAHKIVPEMLSRRGIAMPDKSPEALLEEILSLRSALHFPLLEEVVKRWSEFKT